MDYYILQSVALFSLAIFVSCLFFKDHRSALKFIGLPTVMFFLSGVVLSLVGRGSSLFDLMLASHYLFLSLAASGLIKMAIPKKSTQSTMSQLRSLRNLK